jgi:type I restriction enzyme S subunit
MSDINQGKPGYWKSELGWIPKGWETIKLGSIGELKNGINKDKSQFGSGTPLVNLIDVFGRAVVPTAVSTLVQANTAEKRHYSLLAGDVLFVRSSVKPEGVGLTCVVEKDMPGAVYSGFLIRFREEGRLSLAFKKYCFQEAGFRRKLIEKSTVSANTNINQDSLKKLYLIVPPKEEQEGIANVLVTWDEAITSLESLLRKKEFQKQVLLRQLVNGDLTLPGYDVGDWENVPFGEIFQFLRTESFSREQLTLEDDKGGIQCVHYGDIHAKFANEHLDFNRAEVPFVKPGVVNGNKLEFLRDGDLIIADASEDYEGVGASIEVANLGERQAVAGLHTIAVRDTKGLTVPGFRAYLLRNEKVQHELRRVATGISVYGLSKTNLSKVILPIPSHDEQQRITSILVSLQQQVALMRNKLQYYERQRLGLMQQLLTGATRVTTKR